MASHDYVICCLKILYVYSQTCNILVYATFFLKRTIRKTNGGIPSLRVDSNGSSRYVTLPFHGIRDARIGQRMQFQLHSKDEVPCTNELNYWCMGHYLGSDEL